MSEPLYLFPNWLENDFVSVLTDSFGKITSKCIIVTEERKEHIKQNHEIDYDFISANLEDTLLNPDLILEDCTNDYSLLVIKQFDECGLNVIVRLQISPNDGKYENSVITAFRVGEVSVCRLIKKNNPLIDFR